MTEPKEGFEALFQHDVPEEESPGTVRREETFSDEETEPPAQKKLNRLERLQHKKAQIENQMKAIQARENAKVRKARTRRLIQIGAIACKYLNLPDEIEPSDFEAFLKSVVEKPEVKRSIQR